MLPLRSIAFMTLLLACIFSSIAVAGAIVMPSALPIGNAFVDTESILTDPETIRPAVSETDVPAVARLLFAGDIMLARGVEYKIGKTSLNYPLSDITEYISSADLAIANFEGTIRDEPNQELDGFTFDTTPMIAGIVPAAGFDVMSLSNNHSDNHGPAIVEYTRQTLSDIGITPFGDPYDSKNFVAHKTVNGISIAFIGFHAFGEDPESILETITAEKTAGNFVVVLPHWGNEYQHTPSPAQTSAAHMFVEAGADTVIGAHPHVVQTYENYNGAPIIYSLGNFLFDQDWSVPTQQGLTLGFDIDATSITMSFVPVSVIKAHVTLMDHNNASTILSEHNLPAILKIPRVTVQNTVVRQ